MTRTLIGLITGLILLISLSYAGQNNIKINTDIVNGELVPFISINGTKVITVNKKGNYGSTFERAERIYSVLSNVDQKKIDFQSIRVRRYKGEYVGTIGRIKIFSVNQEDAKDVSETPYKLAKKWANNIESAADLSKGNDINLEEVQGSDLRVPFLNIFGVSDEYSFFIKLLGVLILLATQAATAIITVHWYYKKNPPNKRELLKVHRHIEINRTTLDDLIKELQVLKAKLKD
jgi:hypothetical protein